MEDSDMATMIAYLQDGALPEEDKQLHRIVLGSEQFEVIEGVLYHKNPALPGGWCVVAPKKFHAALMTEAHQGCFAGHLAGKVYDQLRRHIWWKGMKNDINTFCKACIVCASQKGRKTL